MRKNKIFLLVFLIVISVFFACTKKNASIDYAKTQEIEPTPQQKNYSDNTNTPQSQGKISDDNSDKNNTGLSDAELQKIGKKLVKNAEIDIEVENYSKSIKKIKDSLNNFDCYIAEEKETNYGSSVSSTIKIRIKSNEFDKLLKAILSGTQTVTSKTITVEDITEQYIDIYQRLKTKKKVRTQYENYLKKTKTIDDILKVKKYILQIQEEIEVAEGRLKYMEKQANYSTIIINISQNPKEIIKNGFWKKLLKGISAGWQGLLIVILGFFYLWPLWILIVIIIFVIRSVKKKKK